jgi:hypothetical protein
MYGGSQQAGLGAKIGALAKSPVGAFVYVGIDIEE